VASRRGRGYAPEATRALTRFAFTAHGVHAVFARVELSNPPSVRVLEKAGFQRWGRRPEGDTARYACVAAAGPGVDHSDEVLDSVPHLPATAEC
jgi:[ribosomal protein S5]-alanine N-acetyltransferase